MISVEIKLSVANTFTGDLSFTVGRGGNLHVGVALLSVWIKLSCQNTNEQPAEVLEHDQPPCWEPV